jgi:DNA-binding transcriptional MerR regulator/methylmalonyl-CoA mutase cobalamin-binding subunit
MGAAPNIPAGTYPIRVASRLTGLSEDTIRVWEKRYGAVTPARTQGNTRRYSADDIRRLVLLREATTRGHAIRDVAAMPDARLLALAGDEAAIAGGIADPADALPRHARVRRDYLDAARRFDARQALDVLSRAATLLSPTEFLFEVALPVLRETGDLWEGGKLSVAHEHLVSAQVRGLLALLLRFPVPPAGAPRIVIAAPEGHEHEFGALAGALMAAGRGFEVVYLGGNVPHAAVEVALDLARADVLLLALLRDTRPEESDRLAAAVARFASRIEVWIGHPPGHPARADIAAAAPTARFFERFEDLAVALTDRGR